MDEQGTRRKGRQALNAPLPPISLSCTAAFTGVSKSGPLARLLSFLFILVAEVAGAQAIPSVSPEAYARALDYVLIAPSEVKLKLSDSDHDPIRLDIVTRTFAAPVSLATEAQELCDTLWQADSLARHVFTAGRVLDITGFREGDPDRITASWSGPLSASLPQELASLPPALADLARVALFSLGTTSLAGGHYNITAAERAELAGLLPDLLDRDTDTATTEDEAALLSNPLLDRSTDILFRTDLSPYLQNARTMLATLEQNALPLLSRLIQQPAGPPHVIHFSTPDGDIWVGTAGDDIFDCTTAPRLILDPGGNDHYRFGASVSGMVSLVVDLAGDDVYEGRAPFSLAGALDGVSVHLDFMGNDHYFTTRYGLGAACLGVGLLYDGRGDDVYEIDTLGEGAAMAGVGLLVDALGNDRYLGQIYSQGFGGAAGFGALVDKDGFDFYQTGTRHGDSVGRNPPGYISMSQGCGYGIRQYASGGVGVLADRAGNDLYYGGYFCQGTSYWYALGILGDREGDDVYISQRYSQGSGVHLSNAILWDQSGDDRYQTWGVGMGCGHDLAVGMLYEGGGNDSYTTEWLTMGVGNTNGIGIFYEAGGDDVYQVKNTHNRRIHHGWGDYFQRRRQQSIGVFFDLGGGADLYGQLGGNDGVWLNGSFGVGIDE